MTLDQWDNLKDGSIIRVIRSRRIVLVLKFSPGSKCITVPRKSGIGTTTYCRCDRYLFEPTGFRIKEFTGNSG